MEVSSERHAERIRSAIHAVVGSERIGQIRDRVRYDTLIIGNVRLRIIDLIKD